jgi:hypothetical protein
MNKPDFVPKSAGKNAFNLVDQNKQSALQKVGKLLNVTNTLEEGVYASAEGSFENNQKR